MIATHRAIDGDAAASRRPGRFAIIRQALAAEFYRAFHRRCWCAIAAPVQQTAFGFGETVAAQ